MRDPAIETLLARLSANPVQHADDFLDFLAVAARLAALGEASALKQWPILVRQFNVPFEDQFKRRSIGGQIILHHAGGEQLALAIIDAQDFHCFYLLQRDILPQETVAQSTAWSQAAELAPLDADAAEYLTDFLIQFPIAAALRLAVVAAPVEHHAIAAVGLLAGAPPMTEAHWPAVAEHAPQEPAVAFMADGRPSERFQRIMERLDVPMEVPGVGPVLLTRRIGDDWGLRIGLRYEDGAAPDVAGIRLGPWKGAPEDGGGDWVVPLSHFPHMQRVAMLAQPVVIAFNNGVQLKVR